MSSFLVTVVAREWLMSPLVIVLALAPGFGFAILLARRLRLTWPEVVASAAALGVAWTSAVATACFLAGGGLAVVLAAYGAAAVASVVLLALEARRGTLACIAGGRAGLVLAGVAALAAMVERPWFRSDADSFYHMAATRSLLATGRPLVTDPFFGTASRVLDPTSGAWHTVQAVLSRLLATDIATLYMGVTAFGAGLCVLAFWVLARRVAASDKAATVATVAMIAVAYHFDFRVLAYPKHISEGLLFLALALLVRLLEEPSWAVAGLAAAAGFATATTHLAAGEYLFLAGAFLAAALAVAAVVSRLRGEHAAWMPRLAAVGGSLVAAAALSAPVLLPRAIALPGSASAGAGEWKLIAEHVWHLGWLVIVKPGGMYTGGWMLFLAALAILVLAVPPAFRDRDPKALAVVALLAITPLALHDPLVTPFALSYSSYMLARLAALMRFMPFVGVAWALGVVAPARAVLLRRLAVVAIAVAVLTALPDLYATATGTYLDGFHRGLDVFSIRSTWQQDVRATWGPDVITKMRTVFGGAYPVVAAEPRTGYYLAGIEPVAIVAGEPAHSPAPIEAASGAQRRAEMAAFFDPSTTESARAAILGRYGARYVAVDPTSEPEARVLPALRAESGLMRPSVDSPALVLFEVVR
jgi:hypothetical protein